MEIAGKEPYQVRSPLLFIIFNRPDTTQRVFDQIKKAKPARLYVAADGPRITRTGDYILCKQTRDIVKNIDWDCEVKTLFREKNLGCKEAVSSAISWFFDNEEEGIILEDDCLPGDSFFRFCDQLLEKYRFDNRVAHISGCNLQHGKKWGDASYYFSNMTHVWGWASWRRVWKSYSKDLSKFGEKGLAEKLENVFNDDLIIHTWVQLFIDVKAGKIDTWDYQLGLMNLFNNSLSIIPNHNLISNIGFGENSTHTANADSPYAGIPLEDINEITHPVYILPEKQADLTTLHHDFDTEKRRPKHNLLRRRFKRWLKKVVLPERYKAA